MKPKFNYQSYDYSFLQPKNAYSRWEVYFPQAVRVFASTIGFDMATVEPMNEPVGQLYYTDSANVVSNYDCDWTSTTYYSPKVYYNHTVTSLAVNKALKTNMATKRRRNYYNFKKRIKHGKKV